MASLTYAVVNVFTHNGKNGNGLAVFPDSAGLQRETMQRIAKKLGFSETSFVFPSTSERADYRVRFFTPEKELPFAGHPSIGTLFALRHLGRLKNKKNYVQQIGRRLVNMSILSDGRIKMNQGRPKFGIPMNPDDAALLLNLEPKEIDKNPMVVSTGLPQIIVPLKSFAALKRAMINPVAYRGVMKATGAGAVMPFAHYRGVARCRMYAPAFGIAEDPATGSGCGPLACYLVREKFLPSRRNGVTAVEIRQGVRPGGASQLFAWVRTKKGDIEQVEVGGYCKLVVARKSVFVHEGGKR